MRKRRFHLMRPCQRPFLQARRWRRPSNVSSPHPPFIGGAWGHASSRGEGAVRTPNPRQQHETPTDNLLTPRSKKNSRRSKGGGENARAAALGPLLAARLRQLAGGTQRALLDAAHTQGPPHHCNTMMDMDAIFPMVRARPASSPRKDTLSGPPSSGRCCCAPPPLRVCLINLSPLLAPATSLSFIFIACTPLLPPLRALPRQFLRYFSTGNGTPGYAPTASGGSINVRAPPPWFL